LHQGTSQHRVRSVAAYLIHIVRLMELTTLRRVDLKEIKEAGERWANYRGPYRRRRAGRAAAFCFTNVAKNWFRFHGQLVLPPASPRPFHELLEDFVESMRSAQGLSADTPLGDTVRELESFWAG
jgi:integrase/recombinase XerD